MSKTDELKKLAEKLVGSAPDTRRASNVVEYIADNLGGDTEDTDTISEAISYLTDVYTPVETQEKDVTITENGETEITADEGYNALSKVNVTTNVGSASDIYGLFSNCSNTGNVGQSTELKTCLELKNSNVDFSNFTNGSSLFSDCKLITEINANINNKTKLDYCFANCSKLKTCNLTNTSYVTVIANMFDYCSALESINVFDLSSCTGSYSNAFRSCISLSNTSLQNILKTFLTLNNTNAYTKTLKFLGLTSEQATTCTSFDEWTTLASNGWTTGY